MVHTLLRLCFILAVNVCSTLPVYSQIIGLEEALPKHRIGDSSGQLEAYASGPLTQSIPYYTPTAASCNFRARIIENTCTQVGEAAVAKLLWKQYEELRNLLLATGMTLHQIIACDQTRPYYEQLCAIENNPIFQKRVASSGKNKTQCAQQINTEPPRHITMVPLDSLTEETLQYDYAQSLDYAQSMHDTVFENRIKKRLSALELMIQRPHEIVHYSHQCTAEVIAQNPLMNLFRNCAGTKLQEQIHYELCNSIQTIGMLAHDYPAAAHVQALAPVVFQFSALAHEHENIAVSSALADFCYYTTLAAQGAVKIGKVVGTGIAKGAARSAIRRATFFYHMTTAPLNTIQADFIEPLKCAGMALGSAAMLLWKDPQKFGSSTVKLLELLAESASSNPEEVIAGAVDFFMPGSIARINGLKNVQLMAKAFNEQRYIKKAVAVIEKTKKIKKAVTHSAKKVIIDNAKKAIAEPFKVITEELKHSLDYFTEYESRVVYDTLKQFERESEWIRGSPVVDKIKKIVCPREVRKEFKDHWSSLMRDSAKGGKIDRGSVFEGIAGIIIEKKGALPGPLRRDPSSAADFIDRLGRSWDVKTPASFAANGKKIFNLKQSLLSIETELKAGENIILSLIRLSKEDASTLIAALRTVISVEDSNKIITIFRRDI
jgi:hypothetical protein